MLILALMASWNSLWEDCNFIETPDLFLLEKKKKKKKKIKKIATCRPAAAGKNGVQP